MLRTLPRALLFLVLPLILLPVLPGIRVASADEWSAARKAFRRAQRSESVKTRRDAYMDLLNFDGYEETANAVEEIFKALSKEESPAVVMAGVETLSTFQSDAATQAIEAALRKGRGARRIHALIALADKPVPGGEDLLLEILRGKDDMLAAQAALALGRKQNQAALPDLLELLQRDAWQLRAAGARALQSMAGPPTQDAQTLEVVFPKPPAWYDTEGVRAALAKSLASAEGRARTDIISALERITGHEFGGDVEAWNALVEGRDPDTIRKRRESVPRVFGIPIRGKRVVILIDISTQTDNAHPFLALARLKEVLSVPDARPVALPTVRTTKEVFGAHARRLVMDLESGSKFDVIAVFSKTEPVFGRLTPVNSGTRRKARVFIEELNVGDGPNHYQGLLDALDISGSRESVAWSLGPDEIVLLTCSVPHAPKDPNAVTDPDEIAASIGLKARLRMVPIHTVGVGPHPFALMRPISEESGGVYLNLAE